MRLHHREIVGWLRDQGAESVTVEFRRVHPRIWFHWNGRRQFYVTAGTPSDNRYATANAIRDLRHILGIVEKTKRVGQRRPRKQKVGRQAVRPSSFTPGKDWSDTLRYHRHFTVVLSNRLDEAFLNLWRDCMRAVGSVSLL